MAKVSTLIRPNGEKAYVGLASHYDALDVVNKIGIIKKKNWDHLNWVHLAKPKYTFFTIKNKNRILKNIGKPITTTISPSLKTTSEKSDNCFLHFFEIFLMSSLI